MYACVCHKCSLSSKTDLRWGFTDTKTRHTDAHWCNQPQNSVAPHWSWISRNVFENISAGVEVFFFLFYIFRQRQKQTHPSKQTHTYGGFRSFWTGCFPWIQPWRVTGRMGQNKVLTVQNTHSRRNAKYFKPTQDTGYASLHLHSMTPNTSLSYNILTYCQISAYFSYSCKFCFCWVTFQPVWS